MNYFKWVISIFFCITHLALATQEKPNNFKKYYYDCKLVHNLNKKDILSFGLKFSANENNMVFSKDNRSTKITIQYNENKMAFKYFETQSNKIIASGVARIKVSEKIQFSANKGDKNIQLACTN
ncbi:hypothetical protein K2P97_03470 [bacterium]|nr:hypothetical protein [bacterium]